MTTPTVIPDHALPQGCAAAVAAARSILFITVSRIGDTLFATPAIRAVAAACPAARITVLGHPKRAEVFRNLPFIAGVGAITKKTAPWRGRLGGKRHDLAFVYNFDAPLVAYALRVAGKVVAFRQRDEALNRRLFACVEPPAFQSEHAVPQLLRLPAALGIAADGMRLAYRADAAEMAAARARLVAAGCAQAMPLIGLQVASFPTKAYRDWPVEHFAALCERIVARWPAAHFLIFGGAEEKRRTGWLKSTLGNRATLCAGKLSLRETAAMMGLTDCYVGIDTGPTHLMSTWDIPMVAMYHCLSAAAHTGPLDHPLAHVLDHPATGSPRCGETSAMAEISVDAVFATVEQALAARMAGPAGAR
ncbi:MAG: glycosyltransferase family 9 protein [Proteobacteria bacterium]|nr:glycosyltransferase family 9 protein [Pseudomonadota bacterium]HQR04145.1 glycosyltransferase family 9 protein [Rhodocyclaceae bacterium]